MANTGIPHNVDNLTSSAPSSSDMSKAEADKTVVKGIAHKYEGAVKHALGGLTRKPSLKESGEQERNEAIDQIQAAKEARVRLAQNDNPLHQNTMHESEKTGIPDADNVIQHEVDEHPNNPVNEYMDRNPRATDQQPSGQQEPEGRRDKHLAKQMDKRENPVLDPSIVRSQQKNAE